MSFLLYLKKYITASQIAQDEERARNSFSSKLIDLLFLDWSYAGPGKLEKDLKSYLMAGANPNQEDDEGYTPLKLAFTKEHYQGLIKLLLVYGADPFKKDQGLTQQSVIEDLHQWAFVMPSESEKLTFIDSLISRPKKALTPAAPRLIHSRMYPSSNAVTTEFLFSDQVKIISQTRSVDQLTPAEFAEIYKLYIESFAIDDDPTQQKINTAFLEDLTGENKYIELIRHHQKIIGYTIFSLADLPQNDMTLFHAELTVLAKNYRNRAVMAFIGFRAAHGFASISDKPVAIYVTVCNSNSYRHVKQYPHFPMLQPDGIDHLVAEILDVAFKGNIPYVHQGLTTYLELPFHAKDPHVMSNDLHSQFFYHDLLGFDSTVDTDRACPVVIFPRTQEIKKWTKALNLEADHINQYGQYFQQTFLEPVTSICRPRL